MSSAAELVSGRTFHGRRGAIGNRFSYGVDFVLIDPEAPASRPRLFSRNRFNLWAVHDRHHGGRRGAGSGAAWAWAVLREAGLTRTPEHRLQLLTQPSFAGYIFNPVSFWLLWQGTDLTAVIAEVGNTFGDRHNYLCKNPDFAPIRPDDRLTADKIFHVSPFQEIAGRYEFGFDIGKEAVAIRILHKNGADGVIATLTGPRQPLTDSAILRASIRRPAGALRTIALIYWQALKLKLKGARYRTRPAPPSKEVST